MTVYVHQAISRTTITVTSFMMCSAFSLDSGDALGVFPPEINGHDHGKTRGR